MVTEHEWELVVYPIKENILEVVATRLNDIDIDEYKLNNIIVICNKSTTLALLKTVSIYLD